MITMLLFLLLFLRVSILISKNFVSYIRDYIIFMLEYWNVCLTTGTTLLNINLFKFPCRWPNPLFLPRILIYNAFMFEYIYTMNWKTAVYHTISIFIIFVFSLYSFVCRCPESTLTCSANVGPIAFRSPDARTARMARCLYPMLFVYFLFVRSLLPGA